MSSVSCIINSHLCGTNLDFKMEQHIHKRQSDSICSINVKRPGCLAEGEEEVSVGGSCHVLIENTADASVPASRTSARGLC